MTEQTSTCDEQADIPGATVYIPCNRPTDTRVFRHKDRGEGPYHFCDRHVDHNIRRGFREVNPEMGEFLAP